MSAPVIQTSSCCDSCTNPVIENIPGPAGAPGTPGNNGSNGINAFTTLSAGFVQPAINSSVTIAVVNSSWGVPGEVVFIQNGGFYTLNSLPDGTHMIVTNLGYTGNAVAGNNVPTSGGVSPGGLQGPSGSIPGGSLLAPNNLSDVANVSTSRSNLGLGALAVLSSVNNGNWTGTALAIGNGGTGSTTAGAALTALGAQPSNALLTSLSGQGAGTGEMYYTSAPQTIAVVTSTSFGRSALTDATAAAFRSRVGLLLPQYGLLASIVGANMNAAGSDNAITVEASRWRIEKIMVENASISLTTATAGVFTAAGGGGTTLAADQSMAALTASTKFLEMTLGGINNTDTQTAGTIYFRVGTAQGSASTANCWVFGWKFA